MIFFFFPFWRFAEVCGPSMNLIISCKKLQVHSDVEKAIFIPLYSFTLEICVCLSPLESLMQQSSYKTLPLWGVWASQVGGAFYWYFIIISYYLKIDKFPQPCNHASAGIRLYLQHEAKFVQTGEFSHYLIGQIHIES